jgi:hypothetical protein
MDTSIDSVKVIMDPSALNFFNCCRLPKQEATETNFNEVVQQFPNSIVTIDDSQAKVKMFYLPNTVDMWPSFETTKQLEVENKKLFFLRYSSTNTNDRIQYSIGKDLFL